MKILCVCQGGNVRSVTVAYLLKYKYGHDALACGWEPNTEATKQMLYEWAELIVIVQGKFLEHIPDAYRSKVVVYEVGEDRWFASLHPELIEIADSCIQQHMAECAIEEKEAATCQK